MNKFSILIADSHNLYREIISFVLSRHQEFSIIGQCDDSKKIASLVVEKKPHIALVSSNMFAFNDTTLFKLIRKYSPGTKIIVLSNHTQVSYAKKAIQCGARGYVSKNAKLFELMQAINQVQAGHKFISTDINSILSIIDESDGLNKLTEREIEIVNLITQGLQSKEIAVQLHISSRTVEVHRHNIFGKLKIKNAASLVNYFLTTSLTG